LLCVRNLGSNDQRFAAKVLDLVSSRLKPVSATSDQADRSPTLRERSHGRAPDARGCTRDNDNLCSIHGITRKPLRK
jgi:hypothetical protein